MSIDSVPPLDPATTDKIAMRPVSGRGGSHVRAPPPFPATAGATEGAPHPYDSLALPLPESAADAPTMRAGAPYYMEAVRGPIETLVAGRLPEALIRREVVTLMRRVAAAREMDVAQLIESAEATAPERLPSVNADDAHFTFKGRLSATDEDGKLKLFDLYLTRIGARQWEAATFERDPSRASQIFPRPMPPVDVHRLLVDPATGLVLACVAQAAPAAREPSKRGGSAGGAMGKVLYAALAVAAALLVARFASWIAVVIPMAAALWLLARR